MKKAWSLSKGLTRGVRGQFPSGETLLKHCFSPFPTAQKLLQLALKRLNFRPNLMQCLKKVITKNDLNPMYQNFVSQINFWMTKLLTEVLKILIYFLTRIIHQTIFRPQSSSTLLLYLDSFWGHSY